MVYNFIVKNKKILIILGFILLFILSILFGSISSGSVFYGDINLIDEGQLGAWGFRLLQGEKIYRDFFVSYGPLFAFQYYYLFKIFGISVLNLRLYTSITGTFLALIIAAMVINRVLDSLKSKITAILLLFIIPGVYIRQTIGFLVIYFLINTINNKKTVWPIMTGLLISLSFLMSPEIGIFLIIISAIYLIYNSITEEKLVSLLKKIIYIIMGMGMPLVIFIFESSRGGWLKSYITSTQDILFSFSGINSPNGKNFPNALTLIQIGGNFNKWLHFIVSKDMLLYYALFFLILTIIYLLIKLTLRRLTVKDEVVGLITLYGLLMYTNLIGRSGHFFIITPFLIILCAYFSEKIFNKISFRRNKFLSLFIVLIIVFQLLFYFRIILIFWPQFKYLLIKPAAVFTKIQNPNRVGGTVISKGQQQFIGEIQNYVWANTKPNDYVFFLTNEAMMYMLTNRNNPTRYDLTYISHTLEMRLEILHDLETKRPKLIFEDKKAWAVDEVSNRQRLPEVIKFINYNYHVCNKILSVVVYCPKNK